MNKIIQHVKEDWYRYLVHGCVVVTGIIIAFGLEKWHLNALKEEQFLDAYELIAQEIRLDTIVINKNLKRFYKRRSSYERIIEGKMTMAEFDNCYYCPRLATSLYFIYPTDDGFQHLVKQSDYRIGLEDSLNHAIEAYYNAVHRDLPMWQKFIEDDVKQNIEHWKKKMPWYHEREKRPASMVDYQFNSFEYKNMIYVQRNLIYKNYAPLLERLKEKANDILKMIEAKVKYGRANNIVCC